jgi:HK97 family phage portal protein
MSRKVIPASMVSTGNVAQPKAPITIRAWEATKRALSSVKAFFVNRTQSWRPFLYASRWRDLTYEGDGTSSSTVTAPLFWVARTFPEAPPALWRQMESGEEEQIRRHRLLDKLQRPNGFYTGVTMWMATVVSYQVDGNAYWLKLRNGVGVVDELWYVPHWLIEPVGDEARPSIFIDHYVYRPGAEEIELDVSDVVHFRFGLDAENPRLGMSPLKSVLREVYTDDEAANFTASLLRNMGVPGILVAPEKGVTIAPEEAELAKSDLMAKFTGDKRGEPIVMTAATTIEQFGFSPEQLLLRELRRIPEERVTAVMGIPAIVAGLGAGLDRSTFTNMGEAREAAYEAGIIPMQRILAEDIRFQLLPDFEPADPGQFRFGFDLSKVRVLQEDLTRQAQRHDVMIRGGWEKVSEGRRAMGLPVDESHDVFLRPLNVATVDASGALVDVMPTNGNGSGDSDEIARAVARELAAQT